MLLSTAALALEIPLTVEEPVGVARRLAPVGSGVCLPRGEFRADQPFSLFDGDREIPLQTTPLVVERDGSLRWVLLDFQLDVAAKESRRLTLRTQPGSAKPATSLKIAESATEVAIDTGRMKFAVSKTKPFTLFDGPVEFLEAKTGQTYVAGKPRSVVLEYRGPSRVTVRVDGSYEGPGDCRLGYITRITAWAGSTTVRVQHILANSNSEQIYHAKVQKASLTVRRPAGMKLFVTDRDAAGDPPRKLVTADDHVTVDYISDPVWLYDLSHKTAELWIDFAEPVTPVRLMAFAPGAWYSQCDVFGVGRFGTLEDELNVYRQWGWKFTDKQLPHSQPAPNAFVQWEDNHYESEADSTEALLLMAIRTGQRGFFDHGEAWARYHANLHAWRTDGWVYDDGAIWFPQGGPLGTRPSRKPANIKYEHWNKGTADDKALWRLVQAKACYCHFYGAGLVDHFLLTGDRDSLEAAIDLAEQKNSEFRKHRQFTPGKSTIDDTRGFGRGFYVITHLLEAVPDNAFVADLARLCRDVLAQDPNMDERGFAPSHIGTGFGGFDPKKSIPAEMKAFIDKEGITIDDKGWLTDKSGKRWPVVCLGGTWQHAYVQAAADRYAHLFGDEDMADFTDAFGRFATKFLLSDKCKQTHYYAYMDVPLKGQPWDPWQFEAAHVATSNGEGCVHSGWYTRFFPDAITMAYSLTGDEALLNRAREFWHYGSKRRYQTKNLFAGADAVGDFASHKPPKDDSVLSTSRMFYEWSHPRRDKLPPQPIRDLAVSAASPGQVVVRFTAPADQGGGKVARYQVKCAPLPIVAYDDYDFARDDGLKRNFWRATNVTGEPRPATAGRREQFTVSAVPEGKQLYFVVVSYDDSNNRSALSNPVIVERATAPSP